MVVWSPFDESRMATEPPLALMAVTPNRVSWPGARLLDSAGYGSVRTVQRTHCVADQGRLRQL